MKLEAEAERAKTETEKLKIEAEQRRQEFELRKLEMEHDLREREREVYFPCQNTTNTYTSQTMVGCQKGITIIAGHL